MHILRDPRSLIILFLMPVVMVFLYGYAISMDVKNIGLGIWDADQTPESRDLVSRFVHSGYFIEKGRPANPQQANDAIRKRQASAVLFIPNGYGRDLSSQNPSPVGIWVDGSDANTASVIISYVRAILATSASYRRMGILPMPTPGLETSHSEEDWQTRASASGYSIAPFSIRQKVFYNPELKSSHFIVPGLVAILLMMICAMLTSLAIVREKESGTFEQLLVSPIRARELIIGKVLPYLALAFLVAVFILTVGHLHFGVPLMGNLWLLAATLLIYLFCALALGLLISTIVASQRLAMLMAFTTTMLPSVILSGFIFPIRSMPFLIQLITFLVPARYFLSVLRGIMLKDSGLAFLWHQALVLLLIGTVLITVSVLRFRKTMVHL